ncbi:hypothetical protein BH10ACT7_BH10ACT7_25060 [soil metagenome]
MKLVLLAGGIGAGKSSAANAASDRAGIIVVKMRGVLSLVTGADPSDRAEMQRRAAELEHQTDGRWLVNYLTALPEQGPVIVDAVRTVRQARAAVDAFEYARVIYLDADETNRRQRYELGGAIDQMKATSSFDAAMAHPTELEALRIRDVADRVIDTNSIGVLAVADLLIAELHG